MQLLDAYQLLVRPPAMIGEDGMKSIKDAAPDITIESDAWILEVQAEAERHGYRGPLD